MFTAFTFSMTGSRNIHWMPLQLALAVVGVSMESTNHQAQVQSLSLRSENTVGKCFGKCTANVVSKHTVRSVHTKQAIDDRQRILCPEPQIDKQCNLTNNVYGTYSSPL